MDKSFLELTAERYSLRSYSNIKVEDWKIEEILKAAQLAPTAVNYQPQKIYVLKSDEAIEKLAGIRPIFGAKLAFIICYDDTISWKNKNDNQKDSGDVDCAIITTHMMLEAKELGVDTCWIGSFNPIDVKNVFNIEQNVHPVAILVAGYPASDGEPSPRHSIRKAIDEFTKVL